MLMAIVLMLHTPNMTQDLYDRTMKELEPGLPRGCQAHIAGPAPDGTSWRVVTVWESAEIAQAYMISTLRPAQLRAGVAPPTAAPVTWQAHNVMV
jgi:hypothetical protein